MHFQNVQAILLFSAAHLKKKKMLIVLNRCVIPFYLNKATSLKLSQTDLVGFSVFRLQPVELK